MEVVLFLFKAQVQSGLQQYSIRLDFKFAFHRLGTQVSFSKSHEFGPRGYLLNKEQQNN